LRKMGWNAAFLLPTAWPWCVITLLSVHFTITISLFDMLGWVARPDLWNSGVWAWGLKSPHVFHEDEPHTHPVTARGVTAFILAHWPNYSHMCQLLISWSSITMPTSPCYCPELIPAAVRGTLCFRGKFSSALGSCVLMPEWKDISEALISEVSTRLWIWFSCSSKEVCNKGQLWPLLRVKNYLSDPQFPDPARIFSYLSRKKTVKS
jgi:hypothetical protein